MDIHNGRIKIHESPFFIEEQYLRDEAFEHCAFVIWEWVTFKQQHENLSTSCINTINQPEIVMIFFSLFDSLGYWRRWSLSAVGSATDDRAEVVSSHIVMWVYRKVHQFLFLKPDFEFGKTTPLRQSWLIAYPHIHICWSCISIFVLKK